VLKLKSPELIPGLVISTFSSFHPRTAIVMRDFIPASSPLSSKIPYLAKEAFQMVNFGTESFMT